MYNTSCDLLLTRTVRADGRLSTGKSGRLKLADSWEQRVVAKDKSWDTLRWKKIISSFILQHGQWKIHVWKVLYLSGGTFGPVLYRCSSWSFKKKKKKRYRPDTFGNTHLSNEDSFITLVAPWREGSRCLWPGSGSGAGDPVDFLCIGVPAGREQWLENPHSHEQSSTRPALL